MHGRPIRDINHSIANLQDRYSSRLCCRRSYRASVQSTIRAEFRALRHTSHAARNAGPTGKLTSDLLWRDKVCRRAVAGLPSR